MPATTSRTVTILSYLHISLQPVVINASAMAVAPVAVSAKMRRLVFAPASLVTGMLLLQLVPVLDLLALIGLSPMVRGHAPGTSRPEPA